MILPLILFRQSLKESGLSAVRMILITSDSLSPMRSLIVSNVVLSSHAICMTAEISPVDSLVTFIDIIRIHY